MQQMTAIALSSRPFVPGTTGWTAHDLEDPRVDRLWFQGQFEIVNGVLTTMPPAYFPGTRSLFRLVFILTTELERRHMNSDFGGETDIVIDEDRVVRADAVWLTGNDLERQREAARMAGKADPGRTRILVPPTLAIESISPGHERHDERTKRRWYAEFGIPNYWILDGFARSLKCLILKSGEYQVDCEGRAKDELRASLFPELIIPLGQLWLDL
jgi:Uma2 family endonuclease